MMLRIAELRDARGWTQEELGQRANLAGATISRIETGKLTKSLQRLQRIAEALDVSVIDLFELSEADQLRTEMFRLLAKLEPEDQDAALRILRRMAGDDAAVEAVSTAQ